MNGEEPQARESFALTPLSNGLHERSVAQYTPPNEITVEFDKKEMVVVLCEDDGLLRTNTYREFAALPPF